MAIDLLVTVHTISETVVQPNKIGIMYKDFNTSVRKTVVHLQITSYRFEIMSPVMKENPNKK